MTSLVTYILLVALIAASSIWCASIIKRIADTKIKSRFIAVSFAVSSFAITNLLKLNCAQDSFLDRTLTIAYFIIAAVIIICSINIAIYVFKICKGKTPPVLPIVMLALMLVYFVLHTLNVPIISGSPFMVIIGALVILLFESCISPRLFKTGSDYRTMFENSNLPAVVTDSETNIVYRTKYPVPSDSIIKNTIENGIDYKPNEDFIVTAQSVDGGFAIFTKEIKELNMLLDELNETSQQLQKNNELIAREEEIRRDLTKAKVLNRLYEESVNICAQKLNYVSGIICALPENDKMVRNNMLLRAKLLTSYVKSKFELLSQFEQNSIIPEDEICNILNGAEENLKGIIDNCSIECAISTQADIRITMLVLDWIESTCEFALIFPKPSLKIELEYNDNVSLSIALNGLDARKKFEADKELVRKISSYSGKLKMDIFSSRVSIDIHLPTQIKLPQEVL